MTGQPDQNAHILATIKHCQNHCLESQVCNDLLLEIWIALLQPGPFRDAMLIANEARWLK